MRDRNESVPILSSARPFLVLSVAFLGEVCAGISYWWPALQPGLNKWLHFSSQQGLLLLATANSGSSLGIIGGIFHERFGPKVTAAVGAAGLTATFLTLALMTISPIHESFFWMVAGIILLMLLFCYMLYSSCMTIAAACFPEKHRGRVVGLCSGLFGASSGMLGAFQAAFFPSLNSTPQLLVFVAILCLVPAVTVLFVFPNNEEFAVDSYQVNESAQPYHSTRIPLGPVRDDEVISTRLKYCYNIAYLLVISLQASAIGDILLVSDTIQKLCALAVLSCILAFQIIPVGSGLVVYPRHERRSQDSSVTAFSKVMVDARYLYLCLGFFVLIGGGGIAWLVQASNIVSSRFYENVTEWRPDVIAQDVRVCVIIFSACNVSSRLFFGSVLDTGASSSERLMFKFNILHTSSLIISLALAVTAVAGSYMIYLAIGLVGLCHGAWFVSSPALTTLWFGVSSFPRNFALLGIAVGAASASLASSIPSWLMDRFGSWAIYSEDAHVHRVCVGLNCTIPTFSLLSTLNLLMYILGWVLKKRVRTKARVREAEESSRMP
ncbi:Major Facilitator [Gracilaria domingensis]|nr:Major Facilitator [Gracilaria domingensis]